MKPLHLSPAACLSLALVSALVVGAGIVGPATARPCVTPPNGLVSWWALDKNFKDLVGTNVGRPIGRPQFRVGKVRHALRFDEINDFVTMGNPPSLRFSGREFSVELWAKLTSNIAPPDSDNLTCFGEEGACDFDLVSKMLRSDVAPTNSDGWRLLKQQDNRFWFCFGGVDGDNGCTPDHPNTVRSETVVVPDLWYHVAGVRSSSSIKIYVNRVLESTKPAPTMTTDTDTARFLLGRYIPENVFYGTIDEVSVYKRALSAREIASIFRARAFPDQVEHSQRGRGSGRIRPG
jgi:Concanavalin A-like lectin/glucanases superfamily